MQRRMILAALPVVALAATTARTPTVERYELDRTHSYVGFNARHLVVSTVKGRFKTFSGAILLDTEDVTRSTVEVTIETASIDTENERRDQHLRSDDFFNAERFPQIRFVSKRVERAGDGLVLVGDLTMRDVTREVRMPFELTGPVTIGNGRRLGADATLKVNRRDFGLEWSGMQEAVPVVGDEIGIEIHVEAQHRPE